MPSVLAFKVAAWRIPLRLLADGFSDNDRGVIRGSGDKPLDRVLNGDGLIGLKAELRGF